MAPNKFEKHIKKQLQEREIQPSANAWESLSEKLDGIVPTSKKRNYFWYGMAASCIGLLIISLFYFSFKNSVDAPEVQIVDTNKGTTEIEINAEGIEKKDIEDTVAENDKIQPSTLEIKTVVENKTTELKDQITPVEEIDAVIDTSVYKAVTSNDLKEEIISTKILEIVAAVDSLEHNRKALTEAEVDDLLRNAQEEILRDKLFDKSGSVDAVALLTEVENELDQSFRDQIFESLKSGFLKVRTAVANRNN